MTFVLCVFIFIMQFLWKHFDDLVGKGVGAGIIMEFFVYSTPFVIPMALPMAILLASLMTFGNLGERVELTAMKSAGVSLFRIMTPLLIFLLLVSGCAFYFSNNILPVANRKMYTLIASLKHKAPELEIPTSEFYTGIGGYNFYVREKANGLLLDLMIYDFSNGFNNATVMLADSGRIHYTADKKYLLLTLYEGESFENLKKQNAGVGRQNNIPYRREVFSTKEILIDFDSNFERKDESMYSDRHVSKDIAQLKQDIDSVLKVVNTHIGEQSRELLNDNYFGKRYYSTIDKDTIKKAVTKHYNIDSLFLALDFTEMEQATSLAIMKANELKNKVNYNGVVLNPQQRYVRLHQIEWHRKFTLSFACLVFFFIGAPLGAIIRKGGLGMPVVISVIMFLIYYIIDMTGQKMARGGLWTTFEGAWLSSAILLPIGIFLTYKAAVDATMFNVEYYLEIWKKFKSFISNFKLNKRNSVLNS